MPTAQRTRQIEPKTEPGRVRYTDSRTGASFYPDIVPLAQCKRFEYQRDPVGTKIALEVEHDFRPELVGVLTVNKRSSKVYALIDGGTRHEGMTRRGIREWHAMVFEGLTLQQEARMFADLVRLRKGMHSSESYIADLIGEEPITVAINNVVTSVGFSVGKDSKTPEVIGAPAALRKIYLGCTTGKAAEAAAVEEGGGYGDLLAMTLQVIKGAYPELDYTVKSRNMLLGLATFLLRNNMEVDLDRLILRLSYTTPPALYQVAQDAAKGERKSVTSDKPHWMAHAIATLYNQRQWKPGR